MNDISMGKVMYAVKGRRDYIESSYLGNKINTLQDNMSAKLRNHADTNRVTGHLAGFGVSLADLVLDVVKYPLVTIEHLAKAILEPLGVIIKTCTKGKRCGKCTLLSSAKHLGYGVKGAAYTALSPLIALGLLFNSYRTIKNPKSAVSGWGLTRRHDGYVKGTIDRYFPDN